jgi:hypothetical protein
VQNLCNFRETENNNMTNARNISMLLRLGVAKLEVYDGILQTHKYE